MSINRNTILRGPGTVKFGGATVFVLNVDQFQRL